MIINSEFMTGLNQKEILPMNAAVFPYVCKYAELDAQIDQCIAWHWHPALEIDYIAEGEVALKTAEQIQYIKKGELFFVNSGILHEIQAKDNMKGCKIYAHIFNMGFLSGLHNSLFEQKYLFPIIKCRDLETFIIHADSYRRIRMIEKFLKMIEMNRTESFGYEFEIRTELSRFWLMLLEETEEIRASSCTDKNNIDVDRIKIMMQYIHEHYMEKITLSDIASTANISTRECTRCFQRCIKLSPVNYLNEYRIRMAAQMLLQTNQSITTISENCGFSSSSYFGKMFYKVMGCTPKDYRKK
ncbi:MAG: helix-turn-helix domain-containing protein [Lachnospiraceae bacterium]